MQAIYWSHEGRDKFAPTGLDWQDLFRGPIDIAFHTVTSLHPQGLIGRIYVGDH